MKRIIEEQLKRAGLIKELGKIAEGSENKQQVWQEGLRRIEPQVNIEGMEISRPPVAASGKKEDTEETAEIVARSIIPDEFTMAVYRLFVAEEPKKFHNVFGAMFAGLAAVALKSDFEEKYGKQGAEKMMAQVIEKAKRQAKNKEWWKG